MISNVLSITTTPARLDIETQTPLLRSTYINAKLDIEKTPGHTDIYSKNIKCDIDSTVCRAEEGDKTIAQLTSDYAQQGIESLQEYAHNAAAEGQEIIAAQPHEKAYLDIEKQKAMGNQKDYGLSFIPSQGPEITWEKNELYMDIQPPKCNYNWTVSTKPDTQLVRAGSVNISVAQYPSIDIQYVGDYNSLKSFDQNA